MDTKIERDRKLKDEFDEYQLVSDFERLHRSILIRDYFNKMSRKELIAFIYSCRTLDELVIYDLGPAYKKYVKSQYEAECTK